MLKIFSGSENGTSIVELMIAAGLLGFISLGAAQVFKRMGDAEYEAKAKAGAISETGLYLSTMERDFKLRKLAAPSTSLPLCPSIGKCTTFTIDRSVQVGGSDGMMTVRYSTECRNLPSSMAAKFAALGSQNFNFKKNIATNDTGGQGVCFRLGANACGTNQYPQLVIQLTPPGGATLPSYPRLNGTVARFPELSDSTSASATVIGAAVCAESRGGAGANGSDRITIETAYVADDRFRVEKRDLSIPRSNVAKIQILDDEVR